MIKQNTPPPTAITRKYIAAFVKVFVLAAFLVAAVQDPAFAGKQDFKLVNHSGLTITEVHCSNSGDGKWGPNLLANSLHDGQSTNFTFDNISQSLRDTRFWDLRIVFQNGHDSYWTRIDLLKYGKITITQSSTSNSGFSAYYE